mmetsp:Transcript_66397/g.205588  ORF Transcript_66397/g.205588 Transcript_66397/m.205588 type:complete len:310 (-) Transcript_66397:323-1252(-)
MWSTSRVRRPGTGHPSCIIEFHNLQALGPQGLGIRHLPSGSTALGTWHPSPAIGLHGLQALGLEGLGLVADAHLVPRQLVEVAEHRALLPVQRLARLGPEVVDPAGVAGLEHQLADGPKVLGAQGLHLAGEVDPRLPTAVHRVVALDDRALPVQGLRVLQPHDRDPGAAGERRPGERRQLPRGARRLLLRRRLPLDLADDAVDREVSRDWIRHIHPLRELLKQAGARPLAQTLQGRESPVQALLEQEVHGAVAEGVAVLVDEVVRPRREVLLQRTQELATRPPGVAELDHLRGLALVARERTVPEDAAV